MLEGSGLLILLLGAIVFIVLLTAKVRLHPFLVLLLAAYGVGLIPGLPPQDVIKAITGGFGGTLGGIGIVIAAGTIIGFILQRSGAALVMANTVLKWVGETRSVLAMAFTGSIVSIPVFCDSGFVVLSPLNRSLAEKSNQSLSVFAVALSMGLYATHVFVPPTPGPIAAAVALGADLGTVILLGLLVSVPCVLAGYFFAIKYASKIYINPAKYELAEKEAAATSIRAYKKNTDTEVLPSALKSFAPIMIPVLLIALKSIADFPTHPFGVGLAQSFFSFIGNPNTALIIGVFLAFLTVPKLNQEVMHGWVSEGMKNAGLIILITGAGGALGSVLRATPITDYLTGVLGGMQLGILAPFILAAALKTAQGSSTVAIITTAAILGPVLGVLGLSTGIGPALTVLAIGAGSMTVSHANDSYFWVVAQFSDMDVSQAYRLQTLGSLVTGLVGLISVSILYLIFV